MKTDQPRGKTIMIDLGGVFLNRGIWVFWGKFAQEYKMSFDQAKDAFLKYYTQYFSGIMSEEDFWSNYLKETNTTADWHDLRTQLLESFQINAEMGQLCLNLRGRGYKLVLLSDQTREWWPILDNKFKVSSFFDFVYISALLGLHKPDPKLFEYVLRESHSEAKNTIFIDDLEKNLGPARVIGIETILFENEKQLEIELAKKGIKN